MANSTRDIPVIMLTAKAEEVDEAVGFAVGADDYVTKPYSITILIARIRRLLDRQHSDSTRTGPGVYEAGGLVVDARRHVAEFRGGQLRLTTTEFRLLLALLRSPGRAFTRYELMDAAIGEDAVVLERTIDVHVKSLRRKLGEGAELLETVRRVGYRWRESAT